MEPDDIENLMNQLPDSIGDFSRRFAAIHDMFYVQYVIGGGIYGIAGQPSDVLIVEQGKDLIELVERVQALLNLWKLLDQSIFAHETEIYIDSDVKDQGITNIGIIRPFGMISLMAPCVRLPNSFFHIFFLVRTNGYLLAFGRRGDYYFLRRNDSTVKLFFPPNSQATDHMAVAVTWSLEDISISGITASPEEAGTKTRQRQKSMDRKTDPTVPPNTLYTWARRQLLLPTKFYARPGELFNVIMDSLHRLNDEIARTDDIAGFWDEQRKGNKTVRRVPKREPVITRHIESRLRDVTLQKNIDIVREIELGNSKLDLLFSAPLENGETAKVCVELKKNHADDLVHGLVEQLTDYMRRVGTDFGIYCILYFGSDFPLNYKQFNDYFSKQGIVITEQSNTEVLLGLVLSRLPYQNLKIVALDVSRKPSASQR